MTTTTRFVLQSLDQLRWETVTSIALLVRITHARFHQQTMLNVHIERVLGNGGILFELRQQFRYDIGKEVRVATSVLRHSLRQLLVEFMQVIQIDG